MEDVFAVGDRPSWNRRSPDTPTSPSLHQMFALARRMGYEMRPIAGQPDAQRRPPGNHPSPDQNRGFRPPTGTGRDYSRIKCFSCEEFGHMQSRCQRPDSSLPFKSATTRRKQQSGKLSIDRDITHTGLYALHSAPLSSSYITLTSTAQSQDIISYSSTIEDMYRNMRILHESAGYKVTGGVFTGRGGTTVIC